MNLMAYVTTETGLFDGVDDDEEDDNVGSVKGSARGGRNDNNNDDDEEEEEEEEEESEGGKEEENNGGGVDDEVMDDNEIEQVFFGDNYDNDNNSISVNVSGGNDYASKDYPFFDRVWHWISPFKVVNEKNRCAVEARILIEAGQAVDECATTEEKVLHEKMHMEYTRLICAIPLDHFESEAVFDVMLLQLKGAKAAEAAFTGKSLWRQKKKVCRSVKNLAAEMPGASNFHCIPSGQSLRDAFKKLICKKFAMRKGAKKDPLSHMR